MEKKPTIENAVDIIGNHIIVHEINKSLSVCISFGETEISGRRYQIQVSCVPIGNAIPTSGITTKDESKIIKLG